LASQRGMKENTRQCFNTGGAAPYGYRKRLLPNPSRRMAERGRHKVLLETDPERAPRVGRQKNPHELKVALSCWFLFRGRDRALHVDDNVPRARAKVKRSEPRRAQASAALFDGRTIEWIVRGPR
jgi:hypothetical protein